MGYFIITSGDVQFNQTNNNTLGYKVYNWGGGNNTTDTGCKYSICEADLSGTEVVVPECFPKEGNIYYLCNKHMAGDVFFYDNKEKVGFGQTQETTENYFWECKSYGKTRYDFVNVATGKYFVWKALSTEPFGRTLDATVGDKKVVNEGCVTMQAPISGSNFLVVKNANAFDQATGAGFYNETFSSDFYFVEVDPTTIGIEEVSIADDQKETIYDLSGRRVTRPQQGTYIINRKKVLVH